MYSLRFHRSLFRFALPPEIFTFHCDAQPDPMILRCISIQSVPIRLLSMQFRPDPNRSNPIMFDSIPSDPIRIFRFLSIRRDSIIFGSIRSYPIRLSFRSNVIRPDPIRPDYVRLKVRSDPIRLIFDSILFNPIQFNCIDTSDRSRLKII